MTKDMDFCHSREIYPANTEKKMDTATKAGVDAAKTASWWPMRGKLFL